MKYLDLQIIKLKLIQSWMFYTNKLNLPQLFTL